MITKDAADAIYRELDDVAVYLKSELEIENDRDELSLGLFVSSSVDLEAQTMQTFAKLANSPMLAEREKSKIDIHIHTFSCPVCPDFIKEDDCVSNGTYCAYFPKRNDYFLEQMDMEDVQA